MRKMLSVFLSTVLLVSGIFMAIPSTVSAVEPDYGQNMLVNSDFETGPFNAALPSPGFNSSFTAFNNWFRITAGNTDVNDKIIVDPTLSYNHVAKVMQTLLQGAAVKSDTVYELSFRLRSDVAYNVSFCFVSHDNYTTANNGLTYTKLSDMRILSGTKAVSTGKTTEMVPTTDYSVSNGSLIIPVVANGDWMTYSVRFSLGSFNTSLNPILKIQADNYSSSDPHSFYLDNATLCKTFKINNLITDSGFEGYANNTVIGDKANSALLWRASSAASTWFNAKVTNLSANSGTNALTLSSRINTAYRTVSGLKANTDYVFSFYYYLPIMTGADNVKYGFTAIAPSNATIDSTGSTITPTMIMASNVANGTGQWKKQVITFNSAANTSVNVYFRYTSDASSGAASTLLLDDLMMYPLSDVSPAFDSEVTGITCDYGLCTGDTISYKPTVVAGNTFNGWYAGTVKSEYKSNLKISQYNAASYSLSVIENNLIPDAGYENYTTGTNMKQQTDETQWFSATSDSSTWPTATVDSSMSHMGNNSLSLYSLNNCAYRKVSGLSQNTLYSLSFYYYLPTYTAQNTASISFAAVVPGTTSAVSYTANETGDAIRHIRYSGTSAQGTGSWKNINILFDSGSNSSVYLALGYYANSSSGVKMNIDELSLTPYTGDSQILNNDFEAANTKLWSKSDSTVTFTTTANSGAPTELGSYCGKITTTADFKSIFSPTIPLHGGSSYEVSMWLKFDSTYPLTHILPNGQSSTTFADFGLMNDTTSEGADNSYINNDGSVVGYKRYDAAGAQLDSSTNIGATGFRVAVSPSGFTNAALGKWNKFVFTFTAPDYSTANFGVRLNCKGTAYVDGFNIKELSSSPDAKIIHSVSRVGNAIRLTGTQGIRYKNRIDKNALAADYSGYRIVEYGAVAIKSMYLGSSPLVIGGTYTYNGQNKNAVTGVAYRESTNRTIDFRYSETATTIDYAVVLTNIASTDYLNSYTVRPYVILQNESGQTSTVYCNNEESSIFNVAQLAYNAKKPDQSYVESVATRANLYENILVRANYIDLSVDNNTSPITTNFKGISSTVYHCYTFMNDSQGRNYTDAMAATEMDRIKDCGITTVRSIFKSSFAWNGTEATGGWDWESTNMKAVYKWAKMLQDRGIDIAFNAGWHLNYITEGTSSIPEVPYLLGNTTVTADKYGESNGVDYSGLSDYDARIKRASMRYGEWITQAMQAMKAHGVNNVKYLLMFTEPSYKTTDKLEGLYPDEWISMAKGLNTKLTNAGIRNDYKLVGPNQGSTPTGEGLLRYVLEKIGDQHIVDIYSTHFYPSSSTVYDDNYGTICDTTFGSYMDVMQRYNSTSDFWCDEFYASALTGTKLGADNPWLGTQTAVGLTSSMNHGMEGMISWQFSDQLWVNQTNTGGEFVNGYHCVGMEPSLLQSYVPKSQYYATGLTSRYLGGGGGKVYNCTTPTGSGLYMGCVKLADGNWSIIVVNAGQNPATFRTTLGASINATLNRHLFDPASVNPTAEAKLGGIDATFSVTNTLCDTIPSGGVAIYTTRAD